VLQLEDGVTVLARRQAQLDLVDRLVPINPGDRERARRVAAQDLAACVAGEAEGSADPELLLDRGGDLAGGALASGEQFQDPAPDRLAEDVERVYGGCGWSFRRVGVGGYDSERLIASSIRRWIDR
jgi:hypothetical protein